MLWELLQKSDRGSSFCSFATHGYRLRIVAETGWSRHAQEKLSSHDKRKKSTPVHGGWQIYSPDIYGGQSDNYRPHYPESATSICNNHFKPILLSNMAQPCAVFGFRYFFCAIRCTGWMRKNLDSLIENGRWRCTTTAWRSVLRQPTCLRTAEWLLTPAAPGVSSTTYSACPADSWLALQWSLRVKPATGDFTIGQRSTWQTCGTVGDFHVLDSGDYNPHCLSGDRMKICSIRVRQLPRSQWCTVDLLRIRRSFGFADCRIRADGAEALRIGWCILECFLSDRYESLLHGSITYSLTLALWETRRFPDYFRCSTGNRWLQQCEAAAQSARQPKALLRRGMDDKIKIQKQDYLSHLKVSH